jgi:hypothetical protein
MESFLVQAEGIADSVSPAAIAEARPRTASRLDTKVLLTKASSQSSRPDSKRSAEGITSGRCSSGSDLLGDRPSYRRVRLLQTLASSLASEFGRGFDVSNLRYMRLFYKAFPIRDALRHELSWTHYRTLLRVEDEPARLWYMKRSCKPGLDDPGPGEADQHPLL